MAVLSSIYAEIAYSDHVDHLFRAKRGTIPSEAGHQSERSGGLFRAKRGTIPSEAGHEFDRNTHRDNQVQIISYWELHLRVTVI